MTVGYIVCDRRGALGLGQDGVLWHADAVTLFKTRAAAIRAWVRTNAYAEAHNYRWDRNHVIKRVEPKP